MSKEERRYAYPLITWQQYRELIESDNRLKATNRDEWNRRMADNEHRMLYGCKVCGFRGIKNKANHASSSDNVH